MPRRCERPGCSAPAEVAYGFDLDRVVVWLEAVDPEQADHVNAGVLCRRHADALQPPRGWFLDDRREPRPRLFRPSDELTPPAGSPRTPIQRRERRSKQQDATEELPLFPEATDGDRGDHLATADLPSAGDGDDRRRARSLEDTDALPWTPVFDQSDDLGGVLDARSPLLARAFGRRGRPG